MKIDPPPITKNGRHPLEKLFARNRRWSEKIKEANPDFFTELSRGQKPEFLWIGCADSRVASNQIVDLLPGKMFVHRNIANLVIHTDLNCLSVLQYGVEALKIKHIIVCGHYGCGGIQAALQAKSMGLIDAWLQHIRDVYRQHRQELDGIKDEKKRFDRLCELNVIEQVANVSATTTVRRAWQAGRELSVHGLIYSLEDGILKDLQVCVDGICEIPAS
ncbi:MAG: carbonate dehydratase [Deltaproteobacteria bacterium]|nr:carbonate dehydratase [Deltaproteobacteria bacterium]